MRSLRPSFGLWLGVSLAGAWLTGCSSDKSSGDDDTAVPDPAETVEPVNVTDTVASETEEDAEDEVSPPDAAADTTEGPECMPITDVRVTTLADNIGDRWSIGTWTYSAFWELWAGDASTEDPPTITVLFDFGGNPNEGGEGSPVADPMRTPPYGQSLPISAMLHNAGQHRKLDQVCRTEVGVISHVHSDHTAGFPAVVDYCRHQHVFTDSGETGNPRAFRRVYIGAEAIKWNRGGSSFSGAAALNNLFPEQWQAWLESFNVSCEDGDENCTPETLELVTVDDLKDETGGPLSFLDDEGICGAYLTGSVPMRYRVAAALDEDCDTADEQSANPECASSAGLAPERNWVRSIRVAVPDLDVDGDPDNGDFYYYYATGETETRDGVEVPVYMCKGTRGDDMVSPEPEHQADYDPSTRTVYCIDPSYESQSAWFVVEGDDGAGGVTHRAAGQFGCGHAGTIANVDYVMDHFPETTLLYVGGGLHVFAKNQRVLTRMAETLAAHDCQHLVGSHCTGVQRQLFLVDKLGLPPVVGSVGTVFDTWNGVTHLGRHLGGPIPE